MESRGETSCGDLSTSTTNRRRALLIGPFYKDLPDTDKDVGEMDTLLRKFGFDSIRVVCNELATREGIINAWKDLIKDCNTGDAVVIYYSGHGGMVKRPENWGEPDDTSSPSKIQYLVPSDFDVKASKWNGIFDDELSHYLYQTSCQTENVTYILDCCHSARLGRKPSSAQARCKAREADEKDYRRILNFKRDPEISQLVDESWSNPSVVRLSAASEWDVAFQYYTGNDGWRGVMTKNLILSLGAGNRESMSWRNIMVEVAARVRQLDVYLQNPQEPRSAGADTRTPFAMKKDRTKLFSAVITRDGTPMVADIHSGAIHGITQGSTFDLIPMTQSNSACTIDDQTGQSQASTTPVSQVTTEVKVDVWKTFYCTVIPTVIPTEPETIGPFKKGTLVLARERPSTKSSCKILIAQDVNGLTHLRSAISSHQSLTMTESEQSCDLRIQLSESNSKRIEIHGRFVDGFRGCVEFAHRRGDAISEVTGNILLAASRFDAAKTLFGLNNNQNEDEVFPAEFRIEIRKVNLRGRQEHKKLATFNENGPEGPVPHNNLVFHCNDEFELVLEGSIKQEAYASVFRVDAAGNIILLTRAYEDGVRISKERGRQFLRRGYDAGKKRGMVLSWPPEVPATDVVLESFVVLVTNGEADLRSLETVAARDYYDMLTREGPSNVAARSRVDKFKMVRIDYSLIPPPRRQDDDDRRTSIEESEKDIENSPCNRPVTVAERGIGTALRQVFKDVPPFVWVINAHDEEITVTVARERPLRYLQRIEIQASATGAGTSAEFQFREPGFCKKRLAACSDSQKSRAKFPLRKERVGVISIWKGEETLPFIEGDDISAGRIYLFDNTPDLRVQEVDPLEMS